MSGPFRKTKGLPYVRELGDGRWVWQLLLECGHEVERAHKEDHPVRAMCDQCEDEEMS